MGASTSRSWLGMERKRAVFALTMLAPVLLLFLVLRIIPILGTFYLSLHNWNIIRPIKPFVGLANFRRLLQDTQFLTALWNTTFYTVVVVTASTLLALALALLLRERTRAGAWYELILFTPAVLPMVPISMVWKWMYDTSHGIINYALSFLGLKPVGWLTNPDIALLAIIIMSVWKTVGYYMVIFLVGLRDIPEEYHEAAMVDGASGWQVIRYITLPLLRRIILYVVVVATIQAFNVFTPVFVMTTGAQGAPASAVRVVVYEIYQNGFRYFQMGYASAQVTVLFVIVLLITLIQFRLFREKG